MTFPLQFQILNIAPRRLHGKYCAPHCPTVWLSVLFGVPGAASDIPLHDASILHVYLVLTVPPVEYDVATRTSMSPRTRCSKEEDEPEKDYTLGHAFCRETS
jgi:hypothetical protein